MKVLGLSASSEHPDACTPQEAAAIYSAIRNMLSVANVFFELGREGASIGQDGLEAPWVDNVIRNAHLQEIPQLGACLEIINGRPARFATPPLRSPLGRTAPESKRQDQPAARPDCVQRSARKTPHEERRRWSAPRDGQCDSRPSSPRALILPTRPLSAA